jgi:predicted Ser/Thr protein kinase
VTPEVYARVRALYLAARDQDPGQRAAFLQHSCGDDEALRREVEELLAHDDPAETLLQTPALGAGFVLQRPESLARPESDASTGAPHGDARPPDAPERIGPYRIQGVLGQGGMGVVYRAEQDNPRRAVALKVIRPGVESRETLRRFEHEAQVLAWLQHPGIAQIFEAGVAKTDQGLRPFFAMELVAGQPLSEYARGRRLDTAARLALLARVCDAVQHAHQKGVIHRDLKPGNILVDPAGQPKILDFGVARLTDTDVRATTMRTTAGQLVGTLAYMSPEQISGDPRGLDTRSDVYALGVIAYELLAGQPPLDVGSRSLPEAARAILEDEPPTLATLDRSLRGDVTTIIGKALEKDKERRYQSAAELAADLRRYLSDQPIAARPATTMYQLRKFARRNRSLVLAVGAACFVLVAGIVATTSETLRATHESERAHRAERVAQQRQAEAEAQRAEAERQAAIAQAVNAFLNEDLLSAVNPLRQQGRDVTVLEVLDQAAETVEHRFPDQPLVEAAVRLTLGKTYMSLGKYAAAEPHLRRARSLRTAQLGPDCEETLLAQMSLGYLFVRQGRYAEATDLFRAQLASSRRVLGPDHAETIAATEVLGVLRKRQGHYDEAEPMYKEVLAARRRVLGPTARETIVAMNNLAILYRVQRRLPEAEALYVEALALARNALGAGHPDTLNLMNGLAVVYRCQQRFDEAEPLLRAVVQARRDPLGDEHPDTLQSVQNLATFYIYAQEDYAKAEPLYLEVLAARRRRLGEEHPATLETLHSCGALYAQWERYDEAERFLSDALEKSVRVLGPDHPRTADSMSYLATVHEDCGRFAQAESLYRTALAARRQNMGDEDPHTLSSWRGLVRCLVALEHFEEAELLGIECYEQHLIHFGMGHKRTDDLAGSLVKLYEDWGRPDDAAEWRARCSRPPADVTASPAASHPSATTPPGD